MPVHKPRHCAAQLDNVTFWLLRCLGAQLLQSMVDVFAWETSWRECQSFVLKITACSGSASPGCRALEEVVALLAAGRCHGRRPLLPDVVFCW